MGCGAGHGVGRNRLHATGGVVGTKKLKLASRVSEAIYATCAISQRASFLYSSVYLALLRAGLLNCVSCGLPFRVLTFATVRQINATLL